jgi:cytochrome c556
MSRSTVLRAVLLSTVAAATVVAVARAESPPTPGEQLVTYRKSLYEAIAWNVRPMGAMAQDKAPFDAKAFELRSGNVAALTPMLAETYSPETRDVAGSKLKPEMWSNRADFDAKLKTLVDRSAALAAVARSGDAGKAKDAFFRLADACKSCHDKYKAKD